MIDKVTAIAQLIQVFAQLAETEFSHVWDLIHTVKQTGIAGAEIKVMSSLPPIPKQ
jgi:hypothetical protein